MNPGPISYRPVRREDAEAMAVYHHRCWEVSFAGLLDAAAVERLDPNRNVDRFRAWATASSGTDAIVAVVDDHPIGHVAVCGNEVVHLFVDPDLHRLGIGRRLLDAGEEMIVAAGHTEGEVHTIVGNDPAIALYERSGWVVTDRILHQIDFGLRYDEHVLIKRLERD